MVIPCRVRAPFLKQNQDAAILLEPPTFPFGEILTMSQEKNLLCRRARGGVSSWLLAVVDRPFVLGKGYLLGKSSFRSSCTTDVSPLGNTDNFGGASSVSVRGEGEGVFWLLAWVGNSLEGPQSEVSGATTGEHGSSGI